MRDFHTARKSAALAAGTAAMFLWLSGEAVASSIPMPAGSRSWILVSGSDCDDDGPQGQIDRAHCAGEVSLLNQPGDLGHNMLSVPSYDIYAGASIGVDAMHGSLQATPAYQFTFLDMSMIDTYTLNSHSLPVGMTVPVTVNFHAEGTLIPENFFLSYYGGGTLQIKIGNYFNPEPIVIPENNRVNNPFGPDSSALFSVGYAPSGDPIPIDLTATHTFDAAIGTPFDLAFWIGARAAAATVDFSNTATIAFTVPEGTFMTSLGGGGNPTPTEQSTWGAVKATYR